MYFLTATLTSLPPCLAALMQCSGCASITLPQSAAGTTCTSTMETPFTPLWLLCSGEPPAIQSGRAVREVGGWRRVVVEGGNMEMTQVAFGTASKSRHWICTCAVNWLHAGKQWASLSPSYHKHQPISERKKKQNKKKTEITHISLECWFCFWSFCCIFSPCFFSLNNLQGRVGGTLSFDRNSLKNTNTTIIYKPPTVYSAPLRLISCWEFSCSQDIKDYIPTDEKKKNLVFEHTKPRLGVGLLPAINKAYVVHYKCSCCSREGALSHYGCGYICGALHSL